MDQKISNLKKDLKAYDVFCQNDGTFLEPEIWPKCVASMYNFVYYSAYDY